MSENLLVIFICAHLRKLYDIPRSFKFLLMHIYLSLISQLSFGIAAILYPPIRYWPALDRDGVRMLIQPKRATTAYAIPPWIGAVPIFQQQIVALYNRLNEAWPVNPPTSHICFCLAGMTKSAVLGRVPAFTYRYVDPPVEYEETDPDLAEYLPDRKSRNPDIDYIIKFIGPNGPGHPQTHYEISSVEGVEQHAITDGRILL